MVHVLDAGVALRTVDGPLGAHDQARSTNLHLQKVRLLALQAVAHEFIPEAVRVSQNVLIGRKPGQEPRVGAGHLQ